MIGGNRGIPVPGDDLRTIFRVSVHDIQPLRFAVPDILDIVILAVFRRGPGFSILRCRERDAIGGGTGRCDALLF